MNKAKRYYQEIFEKLFKRAVLPKRYASGDPKNMRRVKKVIKLQKEASKIYRAQFSKKKY